MLDVSFSGVGSWATGDYSSDTGCWYYCATASSLVIATWFSSFMIVSGYISDWCLANSLRFCLSFSRSILPYSLIGVFLALGNFGGYSSKTISSYYLPKSKSCFFVYWSSLGLKITRLVCGVRVRTEVSYLIFSISFFSKAKILRLALCFLIGLWVETLIFYFS